MNFLQISAIFWGSLGLIGLILGLYTKDFWLTVAGVAIITGYSDRMFQINYGKYDIYIKAICGIYAIIYIIMMKKRDKEEKEKTNTLKLAKDYLEKGDYKKAAELLKPLLSLKTIEGAEALFLQSSFSIKDSESDSESDAEFDKRCAKMLEQSAELGYLPAIVILAQYLETGFILEQDLERSAKLYQIAALKGHHESMYYHGLNLLYGGRGLEKNEELGIRLIKEAAAHHVEQAKDYLKNAK